MPPWKRKEGTTLVPSRHFTASGDSLPLFNQGFAIRLFQSDLDVHPLRGYILISQKLVF
jgi:hypothetical protein